MEIKIETLVFPTEEKEKIINSLENIFSIDFKKKNSKIIGISNEKEILFNLKEKIQTTNIQNTVSSLIEENQTNDCSKLELNKQALLAGKIHFVEERYVLGNVSIEFNNVEEIKKYLTE